MSQEKLNRLAILSIGQDLLENIEYSNFVAKTACTVIFPWFKK